MPTESEALLISYEWSCNVISIDMFSLIMTRFQLLFWLSDCHFVMGLFGKVDVSCSWILRFIRARNVQILKQTIY